MYGAICQLVSGSPVPADLEFLKWLSYRGLCEQIADHFSRKWNASCEVSLIKLYTALPHQDEKRSRHMEFNEAQRAQNVEIFLGRFVKRDWYCNNCGEKNVRREEKETDVHIAIDSVADVLQDKIDAMVLLSGDSDHAPAFRLIGAARSDVPRVTVVFEPRGFSREIEQVATETYYVKASTIARHNLPDKVLDGEGVVKATRPSKYKRPSVP